MGLVNKLLKTIISLIYLLIVICVAIYSFKFGFSQYFLKQAQTERLDAKIFASLSFDDKNVESYKLLGLFYQQTNNHRFALENFKKAVELRPDDYFLWLELGYSYKRLNDFKSAETAYLKSIDLAPNYFEPKQFLGYLYLDSDNYEQGFNYLSQASRINSTLLPIVFQLANKIFKGNPTQIENSINPTTVEAKIALAQYFLRNHLITDRTLAFLTGKEINDDTKNDFINQLIKIKNYQLAFQIWSSKETNASSLKDLQNNLIINGNFEDTINSRETGFGWQFPKVSNTQVLIDDNNPSSGKISLELKFDGNASPAETPLSQMVLVKPNSNYSLTFAVRTQKLVTGGLPIIAIIDFDSKKMLGRSTPLNNSENQWQKYKVDFKTDSKTEIIQIKFQRLDCPNNPCPVFGKLWLDDLNLK